MPSPADELFPILYDELRRVASRLAHGRGVDTHSLVHEAFLRLRGYEGAMDRAHFFAVAARAMRFVLVDRARHHGAQRRGDGLERVSLAQVAEEGPPVDVLRLDQALVALEAADPEVFAVVELKYFGGLTIDEVSEVLGVGTATVERRWRKGRALLRVLVEEA